MDLEFTYEQTAVREVSERLAKDLLSEAAGEAERAGGVPGHVWRTVANTGFLPPIPSEYGGGGAVDALTLSLAIESLAHGDAAMTAALAWSAGAAVLIARCGTAEQRQAHLPAFATDPNLRAGVAHYEGFGRGPSEYQTRIERDDGGRWRVAGRKVAVPFGAAASPLIVVGADSSGRLRAAILPPGGKGVTVERSGTLIGLAAAPSADLAFDLAVAEDALLGGPDADATQLARAVAQLRLMTASLAIGCAQRAVEYASGYAQERVAFSRPISTFQGVAFPLAESETQLHASRLDVWDAASRLDAAVPEELETLAGETVAYAGAVAARATREAVQTLGGYGYISDHPVERWYRAAAALCALDFDIAYSSFRPSL